MHECPGSQHDTFLQIRNKDGVQTVLMIIAYDRKWRWFEFVKICNSIFKVPYLAQNKVWWCATTGGWTPAYIKIQGTRFNQHIIISTILPSFLVFELLKQRMKSINLLNWKLFHSSLIVTWSPDLFSALWWIFFFILVILLLKPLTLAGTSDLHFVSTWDLAELVLCNPGAWRQKEISATVSSKASALPACCTCEKWADTIH